METREILIKADRVSVVFERIADGKIRVTTSSWDDAKVILPNQVLEAAVIGKQVGLATQKRRRSGCDCLEALAAAVTSFFSDTLVTP
jgi:hypothetical protein